MRTLRVGAALLGAGLIGYGLYGLLTDPYVTDPLDVLWWALGGLLIHDGLWMSVVLLAGALVARSGPLRFGLIVAAAITAVSLPAVLRASDDHGNPSVLPLPYLRNWLLLLAAVALVTASAVVVRWRRRR